MLVLLRMENITDSREPEEKRHRKRTSLDPVTCPVCGITIRENELDYHFKSELEKLNKIKKMINKSPSTTPPGTSKSKIGESSNATKNDSDENCWETYQKIKENRVRRNSKIKTRKRKIEDRACPICSKIITEDLQLHVELCLKKQENTSDESDDEIDVGETYSWCGQTRVRATTLIEGGLSSAGIGTCLTKSNEDEDTEVNIDGDDDTQLYGSAQYSERDIILLNKDDQRLRDLVIGESTPSTSATTETREENNQNVANSVSPSASPTSEKNDLDNKITMDDHSNSHQIIESLKGRIREYEKFIRNKPKCLICLDDFKNPVVSICCWHVHCEECWLYTLGCRKLCPQCNMITSAADLRRIYL
ncbi:CLUMA_CG011712, isoform A [Clunio marinus]|uniref:CLUMA_CG011712, isoform A n=1 Tax=Clunio marinus TaxID=568069 RepID=A0A1J1IDQ8_9DIPT|nr:CLUMA_CG011712, isoform A [Clunio marinus]